ncbi:MAG: ISNCY family transposase [Alphaproteobacteria bacterium]|nr:ISNCY family transposase [Alphaproteobacteria bacterium]
MQKFEDVLGRWQARSLSCSEAAELLGCSERQFRRYRRRFEAEGLEGLFDKRLGRQSAKAVPADKIAWMLELYRTEYSGWNVKHFHERLQAYHGFQWGYTWTKRQLHGAGLVPCARRRGAHRRKRPRKPCEGMMLHQDASKEVWLEGHGALDLVVTMDDATSTIYSAFLIDEEGTASTFQGLMDVFTKQGLPSSFYTDRGSHYFYTPKADAKVDKTRLTQVGRALKQLGIEHIAAYSPQARGRSERMFGTLQDRLIKELAKARITDIDAANRWIAEDYLPRHNAQFAKPPELPNSAFVEVADKDLLGNILCGQHERQVSRDNTVSWSRQRLQLPKSLERHHWVKARVRVHEYPDGTLAIFYGPRRIASYDAQGALKDHSVAPTVASCSPPSRCGLAA